MRAKIRRIIREASFEQIKQWWLARDKPEGVESTIVFQFEVRKELWKYPEGIRFLKNYARHGKGNRKFRALLDLSHKKVADNEVIHLLTRTFEKDDVHSKACALIGLPRIKKYTLDRDQVAGLVGKHGNLEERGLGREAFLYLVHAYPKEAQEMLSEGLKSPNNYIRGRACDEIGERGLIELAPKVKQLIQEKDRYVSVAAQNALERLEFKQRVKT